VGEGQGEGDWNYITARRFFIFLERRIYEGTQWVVFEPKPFDVTSNLLA
jgi:phage tail sheath protein FI